MSERADEALREAVLGILKGHIGAARAVRIDVIEAMTGGGYRRVQRAVTWLATHSDWPVVSEDAGERPGVYIAASRDEMAAYLEQLERRGRGLWRRMRATVRTMRRLFPEAGLFEDPGRGLPDVFSAEDLEVLKRSGFFDFGDEEGADDGGA